MTVKCAICGNEFEGNPNARRAQKYCSDACKLKAYRLRKKIGAKPEVKGPKKTVTVPVGNHVEAELTREQFADMSDGTLLDKLRFMRDILERALRDDETKGSALPAISKQLIDIYQRIDQVKADTHVDVETTFVDAEVVDDGDEVFNGII